MHQAVPNFHGSAGVICIHDMFDNHVIRSENNIGEPLDIRANVVNAVNTVGYQSENGLGFAQPFGTYSRQT